MFGGVVLELQGLLPLPDCRSTVGGLSQIGLDIVDEHSHGAPAYNLSALLAL